MRIVLVSINTRFLQNSLSIYYLQAGLQKLATELSGDGRECRLPFHVSILEFHTGETPREMLSKLLGLEPDVCAIALYIWSVEQALILASDLKQARPSTILIGGGPETFFAPERFLKPGGPFDHIIRGEADIAFPALIESIMRGVNSPPLIEACEVENLDLLPSPYPFIESRRSALSPHQNRSGCRQRSGFVYFESSRGCPYRCGYCLSSLSKKVRYFSLDRIFREIEYLVARGYSTIRFIDRTFNADPARATEILSRLKHYRDTGVMFQFEIMPELLTDELIETVSDIPPGFIQFELGLQTLASQSREVSSRKKNTREALEKLRRLAGTPVWKHLDLIYGMPGQTFSDFLHDLETLFSLEPDTCQIWSLKILGGTKFHEKADELGLVYSKHPPYAVLRTDSMSPLEVVTADKISSLVAMLYNHCYLTTLMKFLHMAYPGGPGMLYQDLVHFFEKKSLPFHSMGPDGQLDAMAGFLKELASARSDSDSTPDRKFPPYFFSRAAACLAHDFHLTRSRPSPLPERYSLKTFLAMQNEKFASPVQSEYSGRLFDISNSFQTEEHRTAPTSGTVETFTPTATSSAGASRAITPPAIMHNLSGRSKIRLSTYAHLELFESLPLSLIKLQAGPGDTAKKILVAYVYGRGEKNRAGRTPFFFIENSPEYLLLSLFLEKKYGQPVILETLPDLLSEKGSVLEKERIVETLQTLISAGIIVS